MKRIVTRTLVLTTSCAALMALAAPSWAQYDHVQVTNAHTPSLPSSPSAPHAVAVTGNAQPVVTTPSAPDAVTDQIAAPAPGALSSNAAPDFAPAPVFAAPAQSVNTQAAPVLQAGQNPNTIMNLRDVVATGVLTNPEYGEVANNRRATDEELNQAIALYYPSIDFRGDTGVEYTNDPGTRNRQGKDDSETLYRYDAGLTLTQMLFDGWETKYENERQKFRVLSASNRVRETAELVGLAIVESYLEVMRQRELLKIARENVAEHMSILDQISDSSSIGRTTVADAEQARARLASARAGEASVREALRTAEARFIQQVGDQPRDLTMPAVPVSVLDANVDQAVKTTLFQSPTIDIFDADIKVAHAEFEGTDFSAWPQVDLQLNGRTGHNLGGTRGQDSSASALVVVNWNLYRGGGDTARKREFLNREAQAKESRARAAREIESDVRQTWARMVAAGERARQFAAQADANQEVVVAYKDQFDLNRRTLLDVLDGQNELFVSRSNMVNNEFLEKFAVYRLLALKGDLLKTLDISLPREADPAKM